MRSSVLFGCVLVLVATFAPGANSKPGLLDDLTGKGGDGGLVDALTTQIVGLWKNDDIILLDHACSFTVTPKIKSWELYFSGNLWCPGWTTIKGEALTRSRSSVVNKTVKDFVEKALKSGLITEEQAKAYVNS